MLTCQTMAAAPDTKTPPECYFLTRLPAELRIRVYELLLAFRHPIKLRQVVAGSANTHLLRANRQIYSEALPVLYERNTISATRNDFCTRTDPSLRTPVDGRRIRRLLVTSFGESIACNFTMDRCRVCADSAEGFLDALAGMPELREVVVDFSTQTASFWRLRGLSLRSGAGMGRVECEGVGSYRMRGALGEGKVEGAFRNVSLARIWSALGSLAELLPDEVREEAVLAELREGNADLPDKIWLLFCAKYFGRLAELAGPMVAERWAAVDVACAKGDARERAEALHELTLAVQCYVGVQTPAQCRRYLRALRELGTV